MSDATAMPAPSPALPLRSSVSRRLLGLGAAAAAVLLTLFATTPDAATLALQQTDAELVMLLRLMAGVKALLALIALAVSVWRLGHPASPLLASAYVLAPALMCAAPVVIWQMAHLAGGAGLFHGGLVLLLLALYADRGEAPQLVRSTLLPRRSA